MPRRAGASGRSADAADVPGARAPPCGGCRAAAAVPNLRAVLRTTDIHESMKVYSRDGQYVGRVFGVGETRFQIERGTLSPHDYLVEHSQVARIHGSDIHLTLNADELVEYHADVGGALKPSVGSDTSEPAWGE